MLACYGTGNDQNVAIRLQCLIGGRKRSRRKACFNDQGRFRQRGYQAIPRAKRIRFRRMPPRVLGYYCAPCIYDVLEKLLVPQRIELIASAAQEYNRRHAFGERSTMGFELETNPFMDR